MADCISVPVSLKVGDNITTDHIMPAGAAVLPYRSNIPKMSEFCFNVCDKDFPARAKACGKSIIVGGVNYGQGSSREHAALVPLYLGVKAVVAKSFARIHKDNLINAGILPLTFVDPSDYDKIQMGDEIALSDLYASLKSGDYRMLNKTAGTEIALECKLSDRQIEIILAGGLIALTAQGKN
jgi:aconitate hydratase